MVSLIFVIWELFWPKNDNKKVKKSNLFCLIHNLEDLFVRILYECVCIFVDAHQDFQTHNFSVFEPVAHKQNFILR